MTAKNLLTGLACLSIASLALPGSASAEAPHDGSWAIQIVTERGDCDRFYRYYVDVEGQAVRLRSPFGATSEAASGLVRPDGRVNATLGQSDDPVVVRGRLAGSAGEGIWSAPSRQCTGHWSAQKRA
jgi:hypothetical protein